VNGRKVEVQFVFDRHAATDLPRIVNYT